MRLIEQHRHFSQHRARVSDSCDDDVALEHLNPSLDQDIEVTRGAALLDDERSRGNLSRNSSRAIVQNRGHPGNTPNLRGKIRHEDCDRRTDNAFGLLKLPAAAPGRLMYNF